MPRITGMITEVPQREGTGTKGKWEMLGVTIEGNTYWGFLPKWARLRNSEGKYAEVDYTVTDRGGLNVADIKFIPVPSEQELKGLDAQPVKLSTQEINTAWMTATEWTLPLVASKYFESMTAAEKYRLDMADVAIAWMKVQHG